MDLGNLLDVSRAYLLIEVPRFIGMAQHRLRHGDPRVVVAEDSGVLLDSGRVAGDFSKLQVVVPERRIVEHHAVLGLKSLVNALHCLVGFSGIFSDSGHDAHSLRLDENLGFLVLMGSDGP